MLASSPVMTVTHEEDEDTWVFKTVTFFRTVILSFKLDETYPEDMPSGDVLEVKRKLALYRKETPT